MSPRALCLVHFSQGLYIIDLQAHNVPQTMRCEQVERLFSPRTFPESQASHTTYSNLIFDFYHVYIRMREDEESREEREERIRGEERG